MSDIYLIPYIKIDGAWTIEDRIIQEMWNQMVVDNTWQTVFYDGNVSDAPSFMRFMQDKKNAIVTAWTDRPVGIAWLNGFGVGAAYGHFCMFSESWGNGLAFKVGDKIVDYWFDFQSDGVSFLNVIIGIVPETNSMALRYVRKLGFQLVGTVPQSLFNHYENKNIGGVICYREREA